jgi:hypothetical protein
MAILEGLAGIGLIFFPGLIVSLLLGSPSDGSFVKITAMIAGAAILSLAVICWLLRELTRTRGLVQGILLYNCLVIGTAMWGIFSFGLTGPGLWLIALLHAGLTAWGAVVLGTKRISGDL